MEKDGLFAHVNEEIRKLAAGHEQALEGWEFFCECPDVTCRAVVNLTIDEFDERRASAPPVPVVAAGHTGVAAEDRRRPVPGTATNV